MWLGATANKMSRDQLMAMVSKKYGRSRKIEGALWYRNFTVNVMEGSGTVAINLFSPEFRAAKRIRRKYGTVGLKLAPADNSKMNIRDFRMSASWRQNAAIGRRHCGRVSELSGFGQLRFSNCYNGTFGQIEIQYGRGRVQKMNARMSPRFRASLKTLLRKKYGPPVWRAGKRTYYRNFTVELFDSFVIGLYLTLYSRADSIYSGSYPAAVK